MQAYSYNNETMEYIGPYQCQLDPVRSAVEGKEIYLLPADATWTAPPQFDPATQRAIYSPDTDSWRVEELPPEPEPEEV